MKHDLTVSCSSQILYNLPFYEFLSGDDLNVQLCMSLFLISLVCWHYPSLFGYSAEHGRAQEILTEL
jgi:hypothetical protein